ncbi:hypothetical protein JW721_02240 [Candidatus Micrarchaeota archaeon]|nr:hypothetical protein [Candidatus Micrarchaeota archaeon]
MEAVYATLNKREYEFDAGLDLLSLVGFSFLAFAIPFLFPHPQAVTGILVNAFLIAAALSMKGRNVLPLILLPSMGALANGLLFGPLTIFLIYLIPFIWIGNFLLVFGIKKLMQEEGIGYWASGIASCAIKAGAIFLGAYGLCLAGVVPEALLLPMGILQAGTALGGVLIVGAGKKLLGF